MLSRLAACPSLCLMSHAVSPGVQGTRTSHYIYPSRQPLSLTGSYPKAQGDYAQGEGAISLAERADKASRGEYSATSSNVPSREQ